ncbi:M23 family metallopeptidase [Streptomyces flavofungini]|uniref:M23 family metallopeptidase n=1 Tax=Streptomyces flavofungini TaxID=68200 RepID=UPI0025AFF6A1|nr:M23 family metallopeptidase [Streptomyces flavofungini]WJV47483.1 M23 family metallopeptidase [Streptomyces flavofungini]
MGYGIDGPREAGTTRRDALGLAAGLLAGGALSGALAPPAAADEGDDDWMHQQGDWAFGDEAQAAQDDSCVADLDERFEADLAAAEALLPVEDSRGLGAAAAPTARYTRPLRRRYRVTSRYGVRGNWAAGHHTGIDLGVPRGTPVYAVTSGVVVLARWSGAYGKAVTVRMPDKRYVLFAHLSRISVRQGQRIRTGARIGYSGATGRATGPHLHLEIRARRGYGSDINPVSYLARRGVRLL